ncbi:MAG: LysM peptidoglycan-binding domain-containing protein, partial [Acidimicrobiia bacterium]|nr:LysM peptidoglycan-binding domain-containing protein [Acidimicrobiia bacterium]
KPGDSVWGLAEQHLGDAHRWRDLFELNVGQLAGGGTLRDPNLIHPGWRLRLPPPDQSASAELAGAAEPDTPVSLYDPVLQ